MLFVVFVLFVFFLYIFKQYCLTLKLCIENVFINRHETCARFNKFILFKLLSALDRIFVNHLAKVLA